MVHRCSSAPLRAYDAPPRATPRCPGVPGGRAPPRPALTAAPARARNTICCSRCPQLAFSFRPMAAAPQPCRSQWRACKRKASMTSKSSSSGTASMIRFVPPSSGCRRPTPASAFSISRKRRVNGESHRDGVLRQARGRIVCYQADDDLWLPGHLQDMQAALEDADFAGAMHVNVELDGRIRGYFFDIERPEFRDLWVSWQAHPYGPWASNG